MKLSIQFTSREIAQLLVNEAAARMEGAAKFSPGMSYKAQLFFDGNGGVSAEVTTESDVDALRLATCS